jgi:hypothetical protein
MFGLDVVASFIGTVLGMFVRYLWRFLCWIGRGVVYPWRRHLREQVCAAIQEGIEVGRQEGIEVGRQEGIEIGRQEGIHEGRVGVAKLSREIDLLMDALPASPEKIPDQDIHKVYSTLCESISKLYSFEVRVALFVKFPSNYSTLGELRLWERYNINTPDSRGRNTYPIRRPDNDDPNNPNNRVGAAVYSSLQSQPRLVNADTDPYVITLPDVSGLGVQWQESVHIPFPWLDADNNREVVLASAVLCVDNISANYFGDYRDDAVVVASLCERLITRLTEDFLHRLKDGSTGFNS